MAASVKDRRREPDALLKALDEVRYGAGRTLNLRASLPTAAEAVARAEPWLRQQQVDGAGEVLVITGRGNRSPGGVSSVREALVKLLYSLRRRGVVAEVREHTPGSFAVTLAPMRAMLESPRRRRERAWPPPPDPSVLRGLSSPTRALLRTLSQRSLESLGVRSTPALLEEEMVTQFSRLAGSLPAGVERESALRMAISRALEEDEEGP